MDIQTILVYLIFAACVISAIRWTIKRINKKKGTGCGCGCPGCTASKKVDEPHNCCAGDKNNRTCC